MSALALNKAKRWAEAVRRLAALEYSLIDACHTEADGAFEVEQARLFSRAGIAQVHLFDLGTVLRELGDTSLSYSRCVRLALLQGGRSDEVARRLEHEYVRLLAQPDMPEGLRVLLRANLAEHHTLGHAEHHAAVAA
jgi:hypothetical protein